MRKTISNLDINQLDTIDSKWKAIKETLKVVTDTKIGKQKEMKKPWSNTACEEVLNRRKEARLQWINDPSSREKESIYKECQKEVNNIFRFKKRKFTKDLLWEAESNHKANKTRELYQKIKSIRGGYKKHERFLKNEGGSLISEQDKILEKWRMYFDQLLNCENPSELLKVNNIRP